MCEGTENAQAGYSSAECNEEVYLSFPFSS